MPKTKPTSSPAAPRYFDAQISQFDGIKPYPLPTTPTVLDVLQYIQGNTLQKEISDLRNLHDTDYATYKKAKTSLPGVTFAGRFSHRSNGKLIRHSGFASIDIDHLESFEHTQLFKTLLQDDPYIAGIFISPSGVGLKVLVKIPEVHNDGEYKQHFRAIRSYLNTTYELTIDTLPDISRLCFMSHDPDVFINPKSKIFKKKEHPKDDEQPPPPKQPGVDISLQAAIKVLLQKGIPDSVDRNQFVGLCGAFKREGLEYAVFDKIMQRTPGYDAKDNLKIWNTVKDEEHTGQAQTGNTIIRYARTADKGLFGSIRKQLKEAGTEEVETYGIATAIKNKLLSKYHFALNMLTDKILLSQNGTTQQMNDYLEAEIRCWLLNEGFSRREVVSDVIKAVSWHHQHHPIQSYFKGLRWDGKDRFEAIKKYIKDPDGLIVPVFASFLIGAVRRTFTGKHHPMPVLVGKQGLGKSHFLRWLCPFQEYYIESPISPDTNDARIRICERFIWEVAELGATTRRQDIEALKWFISLEVVAYRRAHDKYDMTKNALASLIGTVNQDGAGFLNDPTGYRRWRPVSVKYVDYSYEHLDRDQLWAQAYQCFKENPEHAHNLHPSYQVVIDRNIEQEFSQVDPLEGILLQHFLLTGEQYDILSVHEILNECTYHGYRGKGTRADSMYLARVLNTDVFTEQGVAKYRDKNFRGYRGIKRVFRDSDNL